ncbi:MAG TPA: hypothetical protein VGI86_14740, partial [Acidimicrobiia bacterium]
MTNSRSRRAHHTRGALISLVAVGALTFAACSSSSSSHASNTTAASPGNASATSTTAPATAQPLGVTWMSGYAAPGTPAKYDKVGVIKVGAPTAKNVLVLEPGTSAGSAYFVPLAQWIVSKSPGWQVWSVERRENLLEDQS